MLVLPLGLLIFSSLSAVVQAAPVTSGLLSSSALLRRALFIPSTCERVCSSVASANELGAPCAAGDGACLEATCQDVGLDAYGSSCNSSH